MDNKNYIACLEAYCRGDAVGAPFEGYSDGFDMGRAFRVHRAGDYTGTDESSIVRTFDRFRTVNDDWLYKDNRALAVAWCKFHAKHRTSTKYGKTWKNHFALVKFLDSAGRLEWLRLVDVARDANSFGNGCLAMVFPVWDLWHTQMKGRNAPDVIEAFIKTTHYHNDAIDACKRLWVFFQDHDWTAITNLPKRDTVHALGCLEAAVRVAYDAQGEQEMIVRASEIGGDVDSYLSLAFLLHRYELISYGRDSSTSIRLGD